MQITNEQRERLLGQIFLGASIETACDVLGISSRDLVVATDSDNVFRLALCAAQEMRDSIYRAFDCALEDVEEDD